MSLIKSAGAGEQSTGFYKHLLDQSLKFNDDDSPYLHRTPASAGNRDIFTLSFWVKRTTLGAAQILFESRIDGDNRLDIRFTGDDTVLIYFEISNSNKVYKETTQLFRDVSAFYNIILVTDTSDGTQSDRVKLYVNGTQVSSFSTNTNSLSQNEDVPISSTNVHSIGANTTGGAPLDGYLAEINFIDGTALTPASFGETKDGIWIPKDTSGLTFGTNGFHLTFKDDVVSEGFNTVTYTGNGGTQSISGLGFEQDGLVWIKSRSQARGHVLEDVVRGAGKFLQSNTTGAEGTSSTTTQSFDADGFTQGSNAATNNGSGETYVGWCWQAGGAPTADNSASAGATPTAGSVKIDGSNLGSALGGSIAATRLTANTTKGFSIGTFTKGSGVETVAHALGAAPDWLLVKRRNGSGSWAVYHSGNTANPETDYLRLNSTNGTADDATFWGDTAPTSTVFSIGAAFNSGETLVFYAWTDISGYSKFDSYSGSGSSGKTVACGFAPAFVMIKRSSGGTGDWTIFDNTRDAAFDGTNNRLWANLSTAESTTANYLEFTSTGFTLKAGDGAINNGSSEYIFMAFADTREAAFFKDVTTNGNHFTPVNLDYRDSVPDTPTNNFATFNPLLFNANVYSEGNLKNASAGDDWEIQVATMFPAGISGKWYAEFYVHTCNASGTRVGVGVTDANVDPEYYLGQASPDVAYYDINDIYTGGSKTADSNLTFAAGDIISVALNLDDGEVTFRKNNSTMTNGTQNLIASTLYTFATSNYGSGAGVIANFGQDSSFAGNHATANANADANGHGSFAYAPPSGFLALCSQNLPEPEIIDGTENFNTVLYTGNGTNPRSVTGVGFSPDFIWAKVRSNSYPHFLVNSVIGANKYLNTNSTDAETTTTGYYQSFDSDGFTVDNSGGINGNGETFVSWNWLAGTAFSNDASATSVGTLDSSGQVNATAGFSIIKYTGLGNTDQQTISVGLSWSGKDKLVIIKNRDASTNWLVNSSLLSANKVLRLNTTDNDSQVNSSGYITYETFGFRTYNGSNILNLANDYIAYCFHSVEGYSKVGSYVGNGSSDGTFVYTGFRPAFTIIKRVDATQKWGIQDAAREPSNEVVKYLEANGNYAEVDNYLNVDYLSNGFKLRRNEAATNASGGTYIYIAFAKSPQKFANAR